MLYSKVLRMCEEKSKYRENVLHKDTFKLRKLFSSMFSDLDAVKSEWIWSASLLSLNFYSKSQKEETKGGSL